MCDDCGSELLPREVAQRWREFLLAGKTGKLEVDAIRGNVNGAKVTESVEWDRSSSVRVER